MEKMFIKEIVRHMTKTPNCKWLPPGTKHVRSSKFAFIREVTFSEAAVPSPSPATT